MRRSPLDDRVSAMVDEFLLVGSGYQALASVIIFLSGLALIVLQPWFRIGGTASAVLYLWHSLGSVSYAYWTLSNTADAKGYYNRSLTLPEDFSLGTHAIDYITAIFTQGLGLSYLGATLVFNIIGGLGLVAFVAVLQEAAVRSGAVGRRFSYLIAFLPGVSFWTGMIGKDALTFLGTSLLAWGVLSFRRRAGAIGLALLLYLITRPYMLGIIVFGLFCGMLSEGRLSRLRKIVLGCSGGVACFLIMKFSATFLGLGGGGSFASVGELVEYQQSVNGGTSSIDLAGMNVVARCHAYLFRPFFFDAIGTLGLVASLENLGLLVICVKGLVYWVYRGSALPKLVRTFYFVYGFAVWLIMASTIANTGLALRQKWMCMPVILIFAVSCFPKRPRQTADEHLETIPGFEGAVATGGKSGFSCLRAAALMRGDRLGNP